MRVSIFDRDGLATAITGCDAVINLASSLPSTVSFIRLSAWKECTRLRTEGSAAVVDAALRADVPRLVQESVAMIYRDNGVRWIDEESPVDHYPIATGNHAAEANAHRFTVAGGIGVVLRFGLFYGVGAAHSEQIMALGQRHIGTAIGARNAYQSSIYLPDAAAAVVDALSAPAGVYNVVDDQPVTRREHAAALAAATGARPWVPGPGRLARLLGNRTTSLTRSLRVSNTRFRNVTGWHPRFPSVREGYLDMAGQIGRSRQRG